MTSQSTYVIIMSVEIFMLCRPDFITYFYLFILLYFIRRKDLIYDVNVRLSFGQCRNDYILQIYFI